MKIKENSYCQGKYGDYLVLGNTTEPEDTKKGEHNSIKLGKSEDCLQVRYDGDIIRLASDSGRFLENTAYSYLSEVILGGSARFIRNTWIPKKSR